MSTRRVRHKKRGTTYEVLGEAEAQVSTFGRPGSSSNVRVLTDGDSLTVYRCEKTGKLWVRFTDEFNDGRFETLPEGDIVTQQAEPEGMLAYAAAIANPSRDDPNWPLPSFDARDWAEAFCQRFGGDPDLMLSWFANALMRGYDEARLRAARTPPEE